MKQNDANEMRKNQNTDAWFGVVHVKDKQMIHQRSMKNYLNGREENIFVPTPGVDTDEDTSSIKKVIKIAALVILAAFIIATLIMIAQSNPDLLDIKPTDHYKKF